jgi:hypothetical protein
MRATVMKSRAEARSNVRRRPSAKAIEKIEQTIAQLPDLPAPAPISGTIGEIFFDDANTFNCSRCQADSGGPPADRNTVIVEIELYPEVDADGQSNPDNAFVTLHFGGYCEPSERQHLQLNWNELELLAVAFSRAVANAKARGFLPARGETK